MFVVLFYHQNLLLVENFVFMYNGGEVHCLCGKGYVNC
jgi:hypothetical protein